eukprot:3099221-Prymnesium_polylepis.1
MFAARSAPVMRPTRATMSSPWKQAWPASISNTRQPSVHQSTAYVYAWPRSSSGAMYSGVPTREPHVTEPASIRLAKPKSVSLRWPSMPTI